MDSLCTLQYVDKHTVDRHIQGKVESMDYYLPVFIQIVLFELFNKEVEAVYTSIHNKLDSQYNNIEPDRYVTTTVDSVSYNSYLSVRNSTYTNAYNKIHTRHVSSTPELSIYLNSQKSILINIQKEINIVERAVYNVGGIGVHPNIDTLVKYLPMELLKSDLLQYFFYCFNYIPNTSVDTSGMFETELELIKEKILLNKLL